MIALAFYKGRGNWLDWLIRLVTRSDYSHVELVVDYEKVIHGPLEERPYLCWSSSARDGGVRPKLITVFDGNWTVVPIQFFDTVTVGMISDECSRKYDFVGIFLSQFFSFRRQSPNRWFCSEICAYALGLPAPETFSPGTLKKAVDTLNDAYVLGHEAGFRDGVKANPNSGPQLTAEARALVEDAIHYETEIGDRATGTALQALLDWHLARPENTSAPKAEQKVLNDA